MSGVHIGFSTNANKKTINSDDNSFMKVNFNNAGFVSKDNVSRMIPQPNGVPWTISGMSWGSNNQNTLVEFNAAPKYNFLNNLHCKRKAEPETFVPRKQLATEEKMSASFDNMHISLNYTAHNTNPTTISDESENYPVMDLESQEGPKVLLSRELLSVKPEPILPKSILERIENPCTSLVLWRPPKKVFNTNDDFKDPNNNPENQDEDKSRKRREVLVALERIANGSGASTSSSSVNHSNSGDGTMDIEM